MYDDQQRTAPYGPQTGRLFLHQFKHGSAGRLTIFAVVAGLLGLALGAASLTFMLQYRSSAETQIRQLQAAVSNAQAGAQGHVSTLNGLAGKVAAIDAGMAALAPFNQVCSQDLTGPNGPAAFYFMCSATKP